ncbi:hypothetical protein FCM35_KLT02140 [Carex littledalei]|uniref:Uncharacterized protein n=1 Tax=Carex littledalei TaxID=544730 RepID=A0A833VRT2_9POAL|nr:hypothetical protein FCM35_KLT02140 [Carex littledalei]
MSSEISADYVCHGTDPFLVGFTKHDYGRTDQACNSYPSTGVLAFCDGKEEKDAITLPGLGMVDEKETAAIYIKATG